MDRTETYIKMADCEEIQGIRPFNEHNYWADNGSIWLPTQDQLQKMIDWNCYQLSARFGEFVHQEAGQTPVRFGSMEQLWLAFVMKELHQKQWTGEKWEGVTANVR